MTRAACAFSTTYALSSSDRYHVDLLLGGTNNRPETMPARAICVQ